MKKKFLMTMAVMMTVIFMGCGKVPQTQIDTTNAAIEAAKIAEAPIYLSAEFTTLEATMDSIMVEIEVQNGKFFKKFDDVKVELDSALALANKLAVDAVIEKEEVKKETETLITSTKTILGENSNLLLRAPRGKEGAIVLSQIKSEITVIDATLVEVQNLYDNGLYMDAINKVKIANESATKINSELKEAIDKVGR